MARRAYPLLLAGIIFMCAVYAIPGQQAFAHSFSTDETVSFIALVHRIQAELQLVQLNVDSNLTLAQNHAGNAAGQLDEHIIEEIEERNERLASDLPASLTDLQNSLEAGVSAAEVDQKIANIDSLLGETVIVRIDSEQLNNATVQAVVLAGIIDDVLINYGNAFDVDFDMTDMSMMEDGGSMSDHSGMDIGGDEVVNASAYQSARVYANKSLEIFIDDLKPLALPDSGDGETERAAAVDRIEASLVELRDAINDQAPPGDIMTIVHTQIHPSMQVAYNLQIGGSGGPEPTPQEFSVTATDAGTDYEITGSGNATATAATINEGQSLVIEFDGGGAVELTLPKEMIDDITTVNGEEPTIVSEDDVTTTISFEVPAEDSTVTILAGFVVPEFPVIAAILAATIAGIIGYTRFARSGTGFSGRA